MDHHVAEYLHQVPVSMKIRGMTEKYILREAVQGRCHRHVYDARSTLPQSSGYAAPGQRCTR